MCYNNTRSFQRIGLFSWCALQPSCVFPFFSLFNARSSVIVCMRCMLREQNLLHCYIFCYVWMHELASVEEGREPAKDFLIVLTGIFFVSYFLCALDYILSSRMLAVHRAMSSALTRHSGYGCGCQTEIPIESYKLVYVVLGKLGIHIVVSLMWYYYTFPILSGSLCIFWYSLRAAFHGNRLRNMISRPIKRYRQALNVVWSSVDTSVAD